MVLSTGANLVVVVVVLVVVLIPVLVLEVVVVLVVVLVLVPARAAWSPEEARVAPERSSCRRRPTRRTELDLQGRNRSTYGSTIGHE